MHRCLSFLLIPIFVLGHALPHSHAGSGVVEPDGHALRPHIHVHGHHHHDGDEAHDHHQGNHDHQSAALVSDSESTVLPWVDHDSDAIYLAASGCSLLQAPRPLNSNMAASIPSMMELAIATERPFYACATDPPRRCASLPIYLLTASLRL